MVSMMVFSISTSDWSMISMDLIKEKRKGGIKPPYFFSAILLANHQLNGAALRCMNIGLIANP